MVAARKGWGNWVDEVISVVESERLSGPWRVCRSGGLIQQCLVETGGMPGVQGRTARWYH